MMAGKSKAEQYVTLDDLVPKIQEIVNVYRREVLGAIADTMNENAEDFVREVKKIKPPKNGPGRDGVHYRDCWKVKKMRKAKFVRYIGNTKKVKAHKDDSQPTIPLINILEFSTDPFKHRPHVGKALDASSDKIINRIISHIQKAGQ